ncbi:PREDICTED: disrupted in renal carcinoma protein 2 homolog [Acropora digitifera]|uniref:disrupted in renal carcinoma protein 2 homolog n=1 Tax=Acropora digitifera TaxID=70779 RepID=UPI00077AFCA5|nr:PREDICTED: disrupted in renal carcinoma protein 2 homolog [Acropora digitifera]
MALNEERTNILIAPDSSQQYGSVTAIHPEDLRVYKRRWYIIFVYFLCAALNGMKWNTWSPIQGTAQVAFGWSDGTITLLVAWSPIVFTIILAPVSWLMDAKGLRAATLLLAVSNFAAAAFQAIPLTNIKWQTVLVHLGMIVGDVGAPVAMALGPLISAAWFPPQQRTIATAVASLSSYVGVGLAFIVGPLLVPDVVNKDNYIGKSINYTKIRNNMTNVQLQFLKDKIMQLMYIELGVTTLLLLVVIGYFPKKPPSPPSLTATTDRLNFKDGFKRLISNKQFMLLLFINGITIGVYNGWASILDLNLSQFGLGEKTAGWLGFGTSMIGIVSGIGLSWLADHVSHHMKAIQLVLLFAAAVSYTLFTLICARYIPYNKSVLFITCILGGFFTNGTIPLFFEMAVETAYPVAEGITSTLLIGFANVPQMIFYVFPMLSNIGLQWINWCILITYAVCVPLLALWKERYYRSEVDDRKIGVSNGPS